MSECRSNALSASIRVCVCFLCDKRSQEIHGCSAKKPTFDLVCSSEGDLLLRIQSQCNNLSYAQHSDGPSLLLSFSFWSGVQYPFLFI